MFLDIKVETQVRGSRLLLRAAGLHLSDLLSITNCLCFETMVNNQNEKKDTQGATPVLNVLKLVLRNFTFFQTNSVSDVFRKHWPYLRSESHSHHLRMLTLDIIESWCQ